MPHGTNWIAYGGQSITPPAQRCLSRTEDKKLVLFQPILNTIKNYSAWWMALASQTASQAPQSVQSSPLMTAPSSRISTAPTGHALIQSPAFRHFPESTTYTLPPLLPRDLHLCLALHR